MKLWTGAQCAFAVKAFYKNGDSFVIVQREFWREFGIHRNHAVPSAHAIKTWDRNFKATGSAQKKKGGSVKTVRTPENIAVVREAIERIPHCSAHRHSVSLGLSEASVWWILHSSGVKTLNSARSHTNSCGDASESNGWRLWETYRVPRAEWWSSECDIFGEQDFCIQCVQLLNGLNWKWKNLNFFVYTLCSYALKLNKWKHLLFKTFLKLPNSLTHPVYCSLQL